MVEKCKITKTYLGKMKKEILDPNIWKNKQPTNIDNLVFN